MMPKSGRHKCGMVERNQNTTDDLVQTILHPYRRACGKIPGNFIYLFFFYKNN